ncbi:MAG TPA: hypothetical protein VKA54_12435, partial [Gemmatimonadaceae bacterium]|nr:hypothetical protein [Gemmatimonadaceae bacterium]
MNPALAFLAGWCQIVTPITPIPLVPAVPTASQALRSPQVPSAQTFGRFKMECNMNTRVLVGVAVAGVALLASCTQDREATPLFPTQASFAKPSSGSCVALSTTNTNAKAYFAQAQDPVLALIDSLYKYQALGDTGSTNKYGYEALTRLAQAANSPTTLVKGDSLQGNTVAKNILGCMTVQGYADSISFISAFGKKGLFAVRSDSRRDPAISRFIVSGEGSLFGAEPSDSVPADIANNTPVIPYTSWYARLNSQKYTGPILFFGYEVPPEPTFNGETTAGTIYDLSTLPRPLAFLKLSANALDSDLVDSVPMLKAGVCSMTAEAGQILHEHGDET